MEEKLLYNCNKLSLDYLNKLVETNAWKAFATIHAGIHHQLCMILRYKFKKDNSLNLHKEKWNIIKKKYFAPLVNDLFVVGLIENPLKTKLLDFNTKRNQKLGHINIYEKIEIPDEEIKEICLDGIEIIKELDKIIETIFFKEKERKK